jgi:hypothetical protein
MGEVYKARDTRLDRIEISLVDSQEKTSSKRCNDPLRPRHLSGTGRFEHGLWLGYLPARL